MGSHIEKKGIKINSDLVNRTPSSPIPLHVLLSLHILHLSVPADTQWKVASNAKSRLSQVSISGWCLYQENLSSNSFKSRAVTDARGNKWVKIYIGIITGTCVQTRKYHHCIINLKSTFRVKCEIKFAVIVFQNVPERR